LVVAVCIYSVPDTWGGAVNLQVGLGGCRGKLLYVQCSLDRDLLSYRVNRGELFRFFQLRAQRANRGCHLPGAELLLELTQCTIVNRQSVCVCVCVSV
jgi:hypothetical protein